MFVLQAMCFLEQNPGDIFRHDAMVLPDLGLYGLHLDALLSLLVIEVG